MGRKWQNGYRSKVKKPKRAGEKSYQEVQKQGIGLEAEVPMCVSNKNTVLVKGVFTLR